MGTIKESAFSKDDQESINYGASSKDYGSSKASLSNVSAVSKSKKSSRSKSKQKRERDISNNRLERN